MATLATTHPTLLDVAKRTDPDGNTARIVEVLSETNDILLDAVFMEANDRTSHLTTVRSGLPSGTWRKLNYGVQPEKSTTVQVRDTLGMLESYAEVDKALVDMAGDPSGFRFSEDRAFIEGLSQTMADTMVYGDSSTNPERFMGLHERFNDSSAENADNVLTADATASGSDQSSIYLVVWGENTVHGIYPKGSKAGLQTKDLGEVTLMDAAGGQYQGYRTHYKWDMGLVVRDWRYVVRIANVDTSALVKDAATGSDLIDMMTQALELIPNLGAGRPVFYCSRTVRSFLRRQIANKVANSTLTMETVGGKQVMRFDEALVRRTDALLNTEAVYS